MDSFTENGCIADEARHALSLAAKILSQGIFALSVDSWPESKNSPYTQDLSISVDLNLDVVGVLVHREATLDLAAAADALRGWTALIHTQSSFVGAVALARSVYESCVLAAAVTDSTLTPEQRAQRALTRRLARLHATIRLNESVNLSTDPTVTEEIAQILVAARDKKWPVRQGQRQVEYLGERFSVDGLTRVGIGTPELAAHAWNASSALIHGEHPVDAHSSIRFDWDQVPSYLPALWSSGVPAGTEHVLKTISSYIDFDVLHNEWEATANAWDRVCSQMTGWRDRNISQKQ